MQASGILVTLQSLAAIISNIIFFLDVISCRLVNYYQRLTVHIASFFGDKIMHSLAL